MREFSIDNAVENIYFKEVKGYFSEVLSSYYNGNYRAAVVILYTVTITDILLKLKELASLYEDEKAKKILEDIEKLQEKNSRNSQWENTLIKSVHQNTELINDFELEVINHLTLNRHLCAHPVLNKHTSILHSPTKEAVRYLIRTILENILIKSPLLSRRKIFYNFLIDLSENKNLLINNESLKSYLNYKYLSKFDTITTNNLFKFLWKIVFNDENKEADANRTINHQVLNAILGEKYHKIFNYIENEKKYFSQFLNLKFIELLIETLNNFPSVYEHILYDTKLLIKETIEKNTYLRLKSFFLSQDVNSHIELFFDKNLYDDYSHRTDLQIEIILYISDFILLQKEHKAMKDFRIKCFSKSYNYDDADIKYHSLVKPILDDLEEEEMIELLNKMNDNNQIFKRRNHASSFNEIKAVIREKNFSIDLENYERLK